ncbi:MAG: EamA family transporter, partial [Paracoccaceae bacterium]|nr:EamA family transporter [Paracoccaceae bacterium]
LLYYRILAAAGSGNLMLVTIMMPPISIFLGWAVLDERLAPSAFIGCGVIALGLIILDGRAWRAVAGRRSEA